MLDVQRCGICEAGRLIDRNPFQKLGISRGKGRRDQQPPTEQQVWEMIAHARDALLSLAREGEFCFVSLRGEHWTQVPALTTGRLSGPPQGGREASIWPPATSRAGTWSTAGNVLRGRSIALGHQDGGNLVRRLYGHREKGRALDRIVGAYATCAENRPKRRGASTQTLNDRRSQNAAGVL